jgi:hypothetical protein
MTKTRVSATAMNLGKSSQRAWEQAAAKAVAFSSSPARLWCGASAYDVVFRGRKVGRIWKYDYTGKVSGGMARWALALVLARHRRAQGHRGARADARGRDDGLSFSLGRTRVERHNQMKR